MTLFTQHRTGRAFLFALAFVLSACSKNLSSNNLSQSNPESSNVVLAGSKMGINIVGLNDWQDTQHLFVDVMKSARGFAQVAYPYDPVNHAVPLDANGWPTTDFGVYFITTTADPLNRPIAVTSPSLIGTYHLSFNGRATVAATGTAVTVQNYNYNSTTNLSTAQVVWPGNNSEGLALTFTSTTGGVQNLKLYRPGYALSTNQVFSSEFLNAIAPFAAMRFMDTLCTNGASITVWSARSTSASPLQDDPTRGCLSFDYIIELANLTGKDIWINIPHTVDVTAYSTALATLLKTNLTNPNVHVYLEWSNEVWNTDFTQSSDNLNAAVASVNAGDPNHFASGAGSGNQYYQGYHRAIYEVMLMSNAFRSVFGNSAMMTQIRPVFAFQYTYQYLSEDALYYLQTEFGPPANYIYGIAGAPYYSPTLAAYNTVDDLYTAILSGTNAIDAMMKLGTVNSSLSTDNLFSNVTFNGLAHYYGLKSLGYEGGPDTSSDANSNAVVSETFLSDPRQVTLMKQWYGQWLGCGNELINYWNLSGAVGEQWGAYEDVTVPSVKSQTLIQIANTPLSQFTNCQ